MHHPFTWYVLLPEELQHLIGEHTFFALVAALLAGSAALARPCNCAAVARAPWRSGSKSF